MRNGEPFKVWIRRFIKEVKCPHKCYSSECRHIGFLTYTIHTCKKCGKTWTVK